MNSEDGDGFLALWKPRAETAATVSAPAVFSSTFQGHHATRPFQECNYRSSGGSTLSAHVAKIVRDSVGHISSERNYDLTLAFVAGVAVGHHQPQPTIIIVLQPASTTVDQAKTLLNETMKIQERSVYLACLQIAAFECRVR